jgi:hypothetical protein
MTAKPHSRPRGPIHNWKPHAPTIALVNDIIGVLNRERENWPLSVRQVYYRLLGIGYPKSAGLADRVSTHLSNARRAGEIPWEAIYDSGLSLTKPTTFASAENYAEGVWEAARTLRLDRQVGQPVRLLVWTEAKGIVPLVSRIANERGVPVVSGSGYDSTTLRHDIGVTVSPDQPLVVLHVGDLDPHGALIFRAAAEDVQAWASSVGASAEFVRIAVTPEQVADYDLPDDPEKPGNVQVEALPISTLRGIVEDAITSQQDADIYSGALAREWDMRADALRLLGQ